MLNASGQKLCMISKMNAFGFLTLNLTFSYTLISNSQGATWRGPRVNISTGEIEGYLLKTASGAAGRVFLGIPYVQPPIGNLRFANPVPKSSWKGTMMCKEYKPACPQNTSSYQTQFESKNEDCLYLNVFVGNNCNEKNPCPVLYYIHGGGYEFDSPIMFSPEVWVENFASKDVVVVTPAYRLGVLGFWSTGSDEAVGNWAMHDMIEGAKWVLREIRHFGGDPSKITSAGHSSSAMALSLLTMSPRTVGLFERAIIMSGTSCNDHGISNDLSDYQNIAIKLNCATESDWKEKTNYQSIVECMRSFDAQFLVNEFNDVRASTENEDEQSSHITLPRNDGPFGLFPKSLDQLIRDRRPVLAMTGTTKNEAAQLKESFINATGLTVANVCNGIVDSVEYKNPEEIKLQCIKEYVIQALPNATEKVSGNYTFWTEQAETVYEDVGYFAPCHREVTSLASKGSTVYLYSFDYEKTGKEGLTPYHSFDLAYVNGLHLFEFDERDKEIQSRYLPLFVNFVKYGIPTPEPVDGTTWQPVGYPLGSFRFLSVDIPTKMKSDYHKKGVLFWNQKVPAIEMRSTFGRVEEKSVPVTDETRTTTIAGVGVLLLVALVIIVYQLVVKRQKPRKQENILLVTSTLIGNKHSNYETI